MAVFTSTAIVWGFLADKWNRVRCLSVATFFFSVAIVATSFATEYWQVFLSRMALATWYENYFPHQISCILANNFLL
jgi:predicted MFS family arabinose efflux permease